MGAAEPSVRCSGCGAEASEEARFCPGCGQSLGSRLDVQERRRITALFADLVASTSLGEQLDPEIVRGYVARFFARATDEVQRRGGAVEKFSGDAVLALFGLQQAHEDDPERAVRAAVAIHAALVDIAADARERHGVELQARIGIECGEVVAGDPFGGATMATGDALNLAARLEQHAGPGESIVGPRVHESTNRTIAYEPAGAWELAGKREPVTVWRVLAGELAGTAPGQLAAPLTGRAGELALLLDTASRVIAARKAVLFSVLGVPGVGKSRLVQEATARLAGDGWRVLRGRCLPYGDGITYWPIGEIVRDAAGIDAGQDAALALERLRRAVPSREAADRLAFAIGLTADLPVSGEAINAEIAWAVQRFAEQCAAAGPAVLVFEDIHWAEPPLLDLIEHLASWVRDVPLLLVCLARPELFDRRPSWGAGHMETARINLEPLSRTETALLVGGLLGADGAPAALQEHILDVAEGNPLFAEETVRVLVERGQLKRVDDRWVSTADLTALSLPESLEGLIRARLDSVPRDERTVLQDASVVGRVFPSDAVERLVGGPVDAQLDDAVLRDLLARESGIARSYKFRHIVIRDVAYASLPKVRRAALHEAVVEWLTDWAGDRGEEYVEIEAYHREQTVLLLRELSGQADAAQVDAAVRALEHSAQKCARRDDWVAQVRWAERAVALDPRPPERHAELDALLLDGLVAVDEYARARVVGEHLLAEADQVGRRDLRGWALHAIAMERCMGLGPMGGLAAAEPMLSEARRDLEAAGDRARLLRVVRTLGDQHEALGQLERAAERFREVAAIAHDLGDHGSEVRALLKIYSALMFLGRIDEAAAELAAAEARAADTSRLTRASVSWARGLTLYWSGRDPAGGERLIGEALGVFAESGSRSREESLLEHMAWVRRNEGDTRGAIALNERRLAILKEVGNTGRVPIVAAWLSMNHLELGDLDEAQRYAELACGMVLSHGTPAAATASVALGRVRDLQGRDEEAERLLKEAVAGWELTRMQTEAPYFYEALAAFHLRRGQRADGERMARRAEQIFVATFGAQTPALPSLRRRLALARQAGASGAGGEARTSG